jgi:hypothetical protein
MDGTNWSKVVDVMGPFFLRNERNISGVEQMEVFGMEA